MPRNPHDALFKQTFSQVEHAEGELRTVLPHAIVEQLDFSTLTVRQGSFVDETLVDVHTDLLFSVELAGRSALLYLLLEHQSTVDPLMPFRVLRYMVRIWEGWLVEHDGAQTLPVVVPIVLHHSEKGWTAKVEIAEIFDLEPEVRDQLGAHVPRLSFILDDLSAQSDEELQSRAMTALARSALWVLRDGRKPGEIFRGFERWSAVMREAMLAPNGVEALAVVLRYISEVSDIRADELQRTVVAVLGEEVKEAMATTADMLREEGRIEGRIEGERQGRIEGERRVLLRLLSARFGTPPGSALERINAAGFDDLERWAERVLTATTLDDVFADA